MKMYTYRMTGDSARFTDGFDTTASSPSEWRSAIMFMKLERFELASSDRSYKLAVRMFLDLLQSLFQIWCV